MRHKGVVIEVILCELAAAVSKIPHLLLSVGGHSVCCNVATGMTSSSFESHASIDYDGYCRETPR